ncbi:MAG: FixH family protein [Prolixibacteraceae bacterium]
MKIKFNWGTGIVLTLFVMISAMTYLVSIAIRQDYDLVDKDYYQKSVNYQQHIEEVKNTEGLLQKIQFRITTDTLILKFPDLENNTEYSGEIHFYSPVQEKRDLKLPVKIDATFAQNISLKSLERGRYLVKVDWKANKVSYYQEEEIIVGQ